LDGKPQMHSREEFVTIDRRAVLKIPLAISAILAPDGAGAQETTILTPRQKLRTGEIARETGSIRDTSVMQPSSEAVFNTGLFFQAGLRALLPVQERRDVALPGTPSSKESSA
jgi:hypothetical protein